MNVSRNPDSVLAAWLDEGPAELPIDTRQAISAGIRTVRRRRAGVDLPLGGRLRWPDVPLRRPALALGGVAAVVIAAALTMSFYGNLPGLIPAASPNSSPSPSPGVIVSPAPQTSVLRRGDEFIVFEPRGRGEGWNLAARDPETGEIRTIVATNGLVDCLNTERCANFVRKAEWSADGRWVAFEVSNASQDEDAIGPCAPTLGIWVQGPDDHAPRQLTAPCDAPPSGSDEMVRELWKWSPVDAQLAYARVDGETDELVVIDASDGARTSLATGNVDVPYPVESESMTWSPDGSRIAYADGSSVYAIDVDSKERSLLADSFEEIIDIAWSPDETQIMVMDHGRNRIQVMNADGSDLHVLMQGEDGCCDMAWSPSGDRILYLLSGVDSDPGEPRGFGGHSEVWTVRPDGSSPIEIFGKDDCDGKIDGSPAWSPDGSQIAYNAPACGWWVVENADGTGDPQPIGMDLWRSWRSSGLTEADLEGIGQRNK